MTKEKVAGVQSNDSGAWIIATIWVIVAAVVAVIGAQMFKVVPTILEQDMERRIPAPYHAPEQVQPSEGR